LLAEHDVPVENQSTIIRRASMACPALPTCGLSLAESERYLPGLLDRIESTLGELGLSEEEIVIRMTGCPNGCARPYLSEIGLVGRTPGIYNLYLGGALEGSRLNKLYQRDLDDDGIVAALAPLFESYAKDRQDGERFGDFILRTGIVQATRTGLDFHENLRPELRS